jgi:hypothetical protein
MTRELPDLSDLALPGTIIAVRASPGARRTAIERRADGTLKISVTDPAQDGRANTAIRRVLAKALGVAPTRLRLVRGDAGRDKLFLLED